MTGFISNPMNNEAPKDHPWTLWQQAKILGSLGYTKQADENLDAILGSTKAPDDLKTMAEDRKLKGWEPARTYKWKLRRHRLFLPGNPRTECPAKGKFRPVNHPPKSAFCFHTFPL
jgi:hypothetical protein